MSWGSNICNFDINNYYPVINDRVKDKVTVKLVCIDGASRSENELMKKLTFAENGVLEIESIKSYKEGNNNVYEYTLAPIKKGMTKLVFDQNYGDMDLYKRITTNYIYVLYEKREIVCKFDKPETNEVVVGSSVDFKVTCVGSGIKTSYEPYNLDYGFGDYTFGKYKILNGNITQVDENKIEITVTVLATRKYDPQGREGPFAIYLESGVVKNEFGDGNNRTSSDVIKLLDDDKGVSDDKRPSCKFSTSKTTITVDEEIEFTLACNDKYGDLEFRFSNAKGMKPEKHLLFFNRLEMVDVKQGKTNIKDGIYTTYYTVKAKGKNIGKTNIYLDEGYIKNKYGFTNRYVESPEINVKLKPLFNNGCN